MNFTTLHKFWSSKESNAKPSNLQVKKKYNGGEVFPAALPQTEKSTSLSENENFGPVSER